MFTPGLLFFAFASAAPPQDVQPSPATLGGAPLTAGANAPAAFRPHAATAPFPGDGATGVSIGAHLSWGYTPGAGRYELFFGTAPIPGPAEARGLQPTRTFDPGILALDTNYYWRVDTITPAGATQGPIWGFRTLSSPVSTTLLFEDGFESGDFVVGGWTVQNSEAEVDTAAAFTGVYGAQLHRTTWIERALDTTGLTDLRVEYARRTENLDAGEQLTVEWTDGSIWHFVEATADPGWSTVGFDLGRGASNEPNFKLRFRTNADQYDESALVDDVRIQGSPVVSLFETELAFGVVDQGTSGTLPLHIDNTGPLERVTQIEFLLGSANTGPGFDVSIEIGGVRYHAAQSNTTYAIDLTLPVQSVIPLDVFFEPTEHEEYALTLRFSGTFGPPLDVMITGTGGANPSWGFLHPVPDYEPPLVIDYDEDGAETIEFFGNESHTHEFGHSIVAWEWREDQTVISTQEDVAHDLSVGTAHIELTITDDALPPFMATDDLTVEVHSPRSVPGVLAYYYHDPLGGPQALLDNVPGTADFIERLTEARVPELGGFAGGSPYEGDIMVRVTGRFELAMARDIQFVPFGGFETRVEVDGLPHSGPQMLASGTHTIEARFAVLNIGELPLGLDVFVGGQLDPGFAARLTHDRIGLAPIVHTMPDEGSPLGGNAITITGFGFYPPQDVIVHWGGLGDYSLALGNLEWVTGEELRLTSPPATVGSVVLVTVETPSGISAARPFAYTSAGPVPIAWFSKQDVGLPAPTTADWGPDGRLYVGTIEGTLHAITFDDDYAVASIEAFSGVNNGTQLPNSILGLAFNPFDDPGGPVKVYVSHTTLFAQGGGCFAGTSPFPGTVSILTGPNFETPQPLIQGLPTSNHDHGVNGILFDHNGDLFLCQGGNTNGGVRACASGDLPESPLSAALLKAHTSRPGFNGQITYIDPLTSQVVDDQVLGATLDVAPGVDVEVWAPGLRNPYDAVLTTSGLVYTTDNGPNVNFGASSAGCSTDGADPHEPDELNLVERGNFYGHPDRNRGRTDPRQCEYRGPDGPSEPWVFTQKLAELDSSSNGITEYRAAAFGNALRGQIVVQKWDSNPRFIELAADGRSVLSIEEHLIQEFELEGLDVVAGPGGALLAANYTRDRIEIVIPDDVGAISLTPYDIFPWRAPAGGGGRFEIGGQGFGTLASTTVTIGANAATLTSVSPTRIVGVIPPNSSGLATGLLDVRLASNGSLAILPRAFRYLPSGPGLALGTWRPVTALPASLGGVSCGVIGREMFAVGEGSSTTYVYDLLSNFFTTAAPRIQVGSHHASETWGGRFYLFGGLGAGAGKVQIYDPTTDAWMPGTDMPWNAGACSAVQIGGMIYLSGGLVGASAVTNFSVYDPATDTWDAGGALPPLPTPVAFAAAATDGQKLYVFGGRQGRTPQTGLDTVQVFDPQSGTWDASDMPGSSLAPMLLGRAGTGRAVSYFGELYVMGGEDANEVFDEVQAYDPVLNQWRLEKHMRDERHGLSPVRFENRIFVAGGDSSTGPSASAPVESFTRL